MLCKSRVGRRINLRFCWGRKKVGRPRIKDPATAPTFVPRLDRRKGRNARDGNRRLNNRRHQAVVESRRGGLNPLQSPLLHNFIPRHRDFRVAHEDIGGEEFLGDSLAGVNDLLLARWREFIKMLARWIAKYDPHDGLAADDGGRMCRVSRKTNPDINNAGAVVECVRPAIIRGTSPQFPEPDHASHAAFTVVPSIPRRIGEPPRWPPPEFSRQKNHMPSSSVCAAIR